MPLHYLCSKYNSQITYEINGGIKKQKTNE
jgi:hypothetical protein